MATPDEDPPLPPVRVTSVRDPNRNGDSDGGGDKKEKKIGFLGFGGGGGKGTGQSVKPALRRNNHT